MVLRFMVLRFMVLRFMVLDLVLGFIGFMSLMCIKIRTH
jgi:hypothetical protein